MDFLNVAQQIERQGILHYSMLAEKTQVREISGIFQFLAREEKRHLEIFEALAQKTDPPSIEIIGLLADPKKAFESLTEHFKTSGVPVISYDEAYEKALGFENESISLYMDALADPVFSEGPQGKLLQSIIDQEKKHARLISSLMEFLRHPGEWLENAEWHNAEEY